MHATAWSHSSLPHDTPAGIPVEGTESVFSARPSDLSAAFALAGRRQPIAFEQAYCHAQRLGRWRIGATLSFVPSAGASHRAVTDQYLKVLEESGPLAIRPHLLVRPDALGHDRGLLQEVLVRAKAHAATVVFDHVGAQDADAAMECLMDLQDEHHAHLGLSLLASRERSLDDARLAMAWGLRVRLEHDWPAFDRPGSVFSGPRVSRLVVAGRFLQLARLLASGPSATHAAPVSVITHEPTLADQALALFEAEGHRCAIELRQDQPKQGVLYVARQRGAVVRSHVGWGETAVETAGRVRTARDRWWGRLHGGLDTLLPAI